jgi:DNA-binding GntR family transcriptional regulator
MYTPRDTGRRRARRSADPSRQDAEETTIDEAADSPTPRGELAYDTLKSQLMRGGIPLLSRLGEERLASELGVSRTPVREALKRLHAEGLLEKHPEGGYRPVVPDVTVIRHLYEVRAGLELLALQRPTRVGTRHDPTVLEPLRERWARLRTGPLPQPDPSFVLLDESFHIGLARAAGNGVLVDQLAAINQRIRVVRMLDFLTTERIDATVSEHLELVTLVIDGRITEAEVAFNAHLGESMSVVEERVQEAIARMVTGDPL